MTAGDPEATKGRLLAGAHTGGWTTKPNGRLTWTFHSLRPGADRRTRGKLRRSPRVRKMVA